LKEEENLVGDLSFMKINPQYNYVCVYRKVKMFLKIILANQEYDRNLPNSRTF